MAVVGTDVIVDEREIDNTCNLAEEVVLRDALFKAYVVEELRLKVCGGPSRCITPCFAFYRGRFHMIHENPSYK
ncbi:MAG: hypothetical protein L5656_05385 [Thermanaeromonas sp.]|uniref:hypothetical protein n=1 Tax=Thermanaeromonas sp. TaxID=2003697 RepID=UPI002437EA6A|nr:hypothetical protein [Thermanaeromonas sp.]MCG0277945.1 hypothetical protein [Thermanaeromonas sp.]